MVENLIQQSENPIYIFFHTNILHSYFIKSNDRHFVVNVNFCVKLYVNVEFLRKFDFESLLNKSYVFNRTTNVGIEALD